MKRCLSFLAVVGLGLAAVAGVGPAGARAGSLLGAPMLQNPFVLTNTVTGAQVQIMPTTQYLSQLGLPYGASTGSSSSGSTGGAPSTGPCTLGTDSSPDDAHVLVNSADTQFNSLDLNSLALSSDSSSITGQVTVENLGDGSPAGTPAIPSVAGGGDIWYVVWGYGSNPAIKGYFLEAEYPGAPTDPGYTNNASTGNLPVDFTYGTIGTSATGGTQFTSGGAATGSFDPANNRISISAPLTAVGSPAADATLAAPSGEADALLGTSVSGGLLETADKLDSSVGDYKVGQSGSNCPVAQSAGTQGALPTAGSPKNLSYYGGPIVHSIQNHIIWWLPKAGTTAYSNSSACTIPGTLSYSYEQPASSTMPVSALPGGPDGDADYQAIIEQYFKDLNGTAMYNLLTQYADQETGATLNSESLAGTWTDNCGYTSTPSTTTGPIPGGTDAAPIYQLDIQNEVQRAIQVNHWPTGLGNEYYVFTGYGAADCFAPPGQQTATAPTCSVAGPNPAYCAYHGDFMDASGNYVLYADMADGAFGANPSSVNLCFTAPIGVTDPAHAVNGKQVTDPIADAQVSITSHEQFETVNDSEVGTAQQLAPPLGWYDAANGEIGDKCAYNYGNYATDGSNVTLHGNHYIVQQEYSNWNNGCGLTPYQGNGGYGGATLAVPIQKGWNTISVPVSGITNSAQLVSSMQAAGSLPASSITEVQTYTNGRYQTYLTTKPSRAIPLARTNGVLVYSTVAGTWLPSGPPYTTAPTIGLQKGWNLVAATWPNPGLMTDAIFNQIDAEANACSAGILTNQACSPTITEIRATGADGATVDWKPAAADASGNATWPQTQGNQIPFTSGMWVYATKALSWTVQGAECQSVDASGGCS
jgi:hypothetical protein